MLNHKLLYKANLLQSRVLATLGRNDLNALSCVFTVGFSLHNF